MRYRLCKILFALILSTVFAPVFAQAFFGTNSKKPDSLPAGTNRLSPDDFRNKVDSLSKDTKSAINQELNQKLSQQPVTPTPTIEKPPQSDEMTTSTPAAAAPAAPLATPPATTGTNTLPPPSYPPAPAPVPAPAPTSPARQPDVYTGFGAGSSKQGGTTGSGSSDSSGGWNVKY